MSALGSLTEEQKNWAFLRACTEHNLDEGKLVRITEEHYDKALDFLRCHFQLDEPLHMMTGAKWGKEERDMHMGSLCQNISVMIVNEETDEIMSLLTTQVIQKGTLYNLTGLEKGDGLRVVFEYENVCEETANLFEYFNVVEAFELYSLATNRKFRNKGLATKVVKAALAMIRNFGVGKVCVRAEGSSLFTQKIFKREGMICIYTGNYSDYVENGKKVFENVGRHTSINMNGMMVET